MVSCDASRSAFYGNPYICDMTDAKAIYIIRSASKDHKVTPNAISEIPRGYP